MQTVALKSAAGRWVMISTIVASAMGFIDVTGLNVALPALQKGLNANGPDLFWILNGYSLMMASLILIGGALGDKLGRKKVFMTGIFVFIVGSGCCGFAGSITMLVCCRIIQGIGGAMMVPGSLSLISSSIHPEQRGKAIGIWSAFSTVFMMGGPMLGGAFADAGLWRFIFFINIPLGIGTLVTLYFKVSENRDNDNKGLDLWGAGTLAIGLTLLTFGFLRIPLVGFHQLSVYLSLSGGVAFLFVFLLIEKKSSHPMVPLTLFSNAIFSGTNLLTFFLYAGLGASLLFLSLNLVQVQGYSQFHSGLTLLPFTILMASTAGYVGGLADKFGSRIFLIAGPLLTGVGQLLLSWVTQTNGASQYFFTFFPGILILGIGMTLTVAPLTATVMGAVPKQFSGIASGVNNAMASISGVMANAVFGALAIIFFSTALQQRLENSPLDNDKKSIVLTQASNLGNARVPPELVQQEQVIQKNYRESFITAYGKIMRICAGLSFFSALMTILFIKRSKAAVALE
ncbi:MFS transporter [Niastella yeongjuensis]|uniref:MFS transporter n=1 Tax=Niastella yeongjuensis TaxID=354355 RepID=A0A1V9E3S5_9BACT|nr:MFS transporter [Niastella yeongjuensis]OQP40746.1 MFS transporter [Niastella yeongjuensis]SEP02909.1 drug resistance transporter, EmrB/QacA subfamily [Niastella yeongjuensis]